MKTIIIQLLMAYFMPLALSAQPMTSINEFYYVGDVIQMVNCSAAGINAGVPGPGMTWDFSTLTPSGGMSTTRVLHDTSLIFSTSSLMEIMPNGSIAFLQETNTDSYINGIYDTGTGITTYYQNYDVAKRPFAYNTTKVDSYYVNIPASSTYGTGVLTQTGDAYGTLILPTGTYTNVLRIKKVQYENDTSGSSILTSSSTSYLWFDTGIAAPLLVIDSASNISSQTQSVMYLSSFTKTGITNVNNPQYLYSGYFDNTGNLRLSGFEADKIYTVTVYNIIGSKVYSDEFSASANSLIFNMGRQINAGIYIVNIAVKDEAPSAAGVLKIVKNS